MADRVIVDGAGWSGDGLAGLVAMASLPEPVRGRDRRLRAHSPGALARGDRLDVRPAGAAAVSHPASTGSRSATRPAMGRPGMTNVVRPVYHVAWLASRLGMAVLSPIARRHGAVERVQRPPPAGPSPGAGRHPPGRVDVAARHDPVRRAARDPQPRGAVGRRDRVRGRRRRPGLVRRRGRCRSGRSSRHGCASRSSSR